MDGDNGGWDEVCSIKIGMETIETSTLVFSVRNLGWIKETGNEVVFSANGKFIQFKSRV